ncbi:hypothetical protein P7K49_012680 [Saguinus oedipus]|uniref:Glycoside hydrolase family 38 N-terminal domain-containing protein n=1 Tax=Saguinus oedipus TaxID=9490 RepID=A0ABQ9VEC8_SAGOE|nr:hypothetical protein P7K49_012680 [Saguinus oedipus]
MSKASREQAQRGKGRARSAEGSTLFAREAPRQKPAATGARQGQAAENAPRRWLPSRRRALRPLRDELRALLRFRRAPGPGPGCCACALRFRGAGPGGAGRGPRRPDLLSAPQGIRRPGWAARLSPPRGLADPRGAGAAERAGDPGPSWRAAAARGTGGDGWAGTRLRLRRCLRAGRCPLACEGRLPRGGRALTGGRRRLREGAGGGLRPGPGAYLFCPGGRRKTWRQGPQSGLLSAVRPTLDSAVSALPPSWADKRGPRAAAAWVFSLYLMLDRVQHDPTRHQNGGNFPRSQISVLQNRIEQLEQLLEENHEIISHIKDSVLELTANAEGPPALLPYYTVNGSWVVPPEPRPSFFSISPQDCQFALGGRGQKPELQMLAVSEELPFDNVDGGVWRQGFDISYDPHDWDTEDLQVFVVPHSHNDPGWIKTFDKYYTEQTQHILNSMVSKLQEDPRRRFLWAEVSFFAKWWDNINAQKRAALEIATGGWVMPDEANSHYFALIDQLIEGHQWLERNLGKSRRRHGGLPLPGLGPQCYSRGGSFLGTSHHVGLV